MRGCLMVALSMIGWMVIMFLVFGVIALIIVAILQSLGVPILM